MPISRRACGSRTSTLLCDRAVTGGRSR
jgi:hypothetical protein